METLDLDYILSPFWPRETTVTLVSGTHVVTPLMKSIVSSDSPPISVEIDENDGLTPQLTRIGQPVKNRGVKRDIGVAFGDGKETICIEEGGRRTKSAKVNTSRRSISPIILPSSSTSPNTKPLPSTLPRLNLNPHLPILPHHGGSLVPPPTTPASSSSTQHIADRSVVTPTTAGGVGLYLNMSRIVRNANKGQQLHERERRVSVLTSMLSNYNPSPPIPRRTKLYDLPSPCPHRTISGAVVRDVDSKGVLEKLQTQVVIKAKIKLMEFKRRGRFRGGILETVLEET
mmetsp:Transcript_5485/g.10987  ORF Transcript_5485/g.10987 Transcript_5485/m.10987 type:complete len:287 (-) Transcript_5485:314-1174(-)